MLYSRLLLPNLERTHEQPRPWLRWRLHRKVWWLCHASPADTPWLSSSAPPACMSRASSFTPELTWLLPLHSAPTPHVGSVPSTRLLSGLTSKTWILLQKTHWQEGHAKIQTLLGNKGQDRVRTLVFGFSRGQRWLRKNPRDLSSGRQNSPISSLQISTDTCRTISLFWEEREFFRWA